MFVSEGEAVSVEDDYAQTQERVRRWGAAFKTSQILGQVLKKLPGGYKGASQDGDSTGVIWGCSKGTDGCVDPSRGQPCGNRIGFRSASFGILVIP